MVEFSDDQKKTLNLLVNKGDNVFLTGGAGTGKSFVLNSYINEICGKWSDKSRFPVLGSTGVSAMLIGGRTFHSFFGLGIESSYSSVEQVVRKSVGNKFVCQRIEAAEIIFIDEISMIQSRLFTAADMICRSILGNSEPFGGIRIIACGDFLQIPPVSENELTIDWCFDSESWKELDFRNCILNVVHRTGDYEFSQILNKVRIGTYDTEVYDLLRSRVINEKSVDSFIGTKLVPYRKYVNNINLKKLKELPGKERIYASEYKGKLEYKDSIYKSSPIDESLKLKIDALVMFRKNDREGRYVNGTLGVVTEMGDSFVQVTPCREKYLSIKVEKHEFEYLSGSGSVLGSVSNFPLSLAWACTIHKSQGATIDNICIDLRGVWEYGQSYVALSRTKSRDGLNIVGWDENSIKASADAISFYENLSNYIYEDDGFYKDSLFPEEKPDNNSSCKQLDEVKLDNILERFCAK